MHCFQSVVFDGPFVVKLEKISRGTVRQRIDMNSRKPNVFKGFGGVQRRKSRRGDRTTDVTGAISLEEGREMVMPGDNVKVTVKLHTSIAMEEGLRFAVREGGKTVGAGVVAKILA